MKSTLPLDEFDRVFCLYQDNLQEKKQHAIFWHLGSSHSEKENDASTLKDYLLISLYFI